MPLGVQAYNYQRFPTASSHCVVPTGPTDLLAGTTLLSVAIVDGLQETLALGSKTGGTYAPQIGLRTHADNLFQLQRVLLHHPDEEIRSLPDLANSLRVERSHDKVLRQLGQPQLPHTYAWASSLPHHHTSLSHLQRPKIMCRSATDPSVSTVPRVNTLVIANAYAKGTAGHSGHRSLLSAA